MKKNKFLTYLIPVITLVIGFLAGLLVNYPPTDESELAGTVGKLNNYRNVKVSENDLLLRNELLDDTELAGQLQRYLSLHFLNTADLSEKVNTAVSAARSAVEFNTLHSQVVDDLAQLGLYLGEARKDLLLALSALDNLAETDQQSLGLLLNNATNALAQVNFREQKVLDFTEAAGTFLNEKGSSNFPALAQSHDLLLLTQVRSALLSQDKLKLKALDGETLLTTKDSLVNLLALNGDQLKQLALNDLNGLGNLVTDKEKLLSTLDVERLGLLSKPENLGLSSDKDKLGQSSDKEKLGYSQDRDKLGEALDKEKLGYSQDKDKLGLSGDKDKLGVIVDSQKLNNFLNQSAIGSSFDKEKLGSNNR